MGSLLSRLKRIFGMNKKSDIDMLLDQFETKVQPTHPLIIEHVDFEERRHRNKCIPRYVYSRKNIKYYSNGTMYVDDIDRTYQDNDTDYPYTQSEIRN